MNITIFGSGYVGLVQAAIFADVGHRVVCMDVNAERVDRLRAAEVPFFEPGLAALLKSGMDNQLLSFTTDAKAAVQASDYQFICVGTPAKSDGSADLTYVMQVADSIARYMTSRKVVITKSTVPVGTTDAVLAHIKQALHDQGAGDHRGGRLQPRIPQGGLGGIRLPEPRPYRDRHPLAEGAGGNAAHVPGL